MRTAERTATYMSARSNCRDCHVESRSVVALCLPPHLFCAQLVRTVCAAQGLPMPGPPAPAPRAAAARPLTSDTLRIREVWADNLDEEMALINVVVEEFNYLAMDTEFPGVVRAAPATSRNSCRRTADARAQSMRRAGVLYGPLLG